MRLFFFITFAWQPIVRFTSMFGFSSVIFFYLYCFYFFHFDAHKKRQLHCYWNYRLIVYKYVKTFKSLHISSSMQLARCQIAPLWF